MGNIQSFSSIFIMFLILNIRAIEDISVDTVERNLFDNA